MALFWSDKDLKLYFNRDHKYTLSMANYKFFLFFTVLLDHPSWNLIVAMPQTLQHILCRDLNLQMWKLVCSMSSFYLKKCYDRRQKGFLMFFDFGSIRNEEFELHYYCHWFLNFCDFWRVIDECGSFLDWLHH